MRKRRSNLILQIYPKGTGFLYPLSHLTFRSATTSRIRSTLLSTLPDPSSISTTTSRNVATSAQVSPASARCSTVSASSSSFSPWSSSYTTSMSSQSPKSNRIGQYTPLPSSVCSATSTSTSSGSSSSSPGASFASGLCSMASIRQRTWSAA